ncbi:ATP-binding protein [Streptomyces sp. NPDC056468]|uniref:ATP-binding protein n=1 Tax=Streptomyces sp. NPDC056468 TaxID=3345830 RepID=UPI003684A946
MIKRPEYLRSRPWQPSNARGPSANPSASRSSVDPRVDHEGRPQRRRLRTPLWMGRAGNLVIAGPSGTGKSHFTEGLAPAGIEKDLRMSWFTLETLNAAMAKSKVDWSTARTVARICRADLIVVDDIGLLAQVCGQWCSWGWGSVQGDHSLPGEGLG